MKITLDEIEQVINHLSAAITYAKEARRVAKRVYGSESEISAQMKTAYRSAQPKEQTMAGYNGWKNYETWAVKLWIDNEQGSYEYWREQTREAWKQADGPKAYTSETRRRRALCILSDMLNDQHAAVRPEITGVFADLLGAALSEVDWYEIAEHMLDDEELEDADEQA